MSRDKQGSLTYCELGKHEAPSKLRNYFEWSVSMCDTCQTEYLQRDKPTIQTIQVNNLDDVRTVLLRMVGFLTAQQMHGDHNPYIVTLLKELEASDDRIAEAMTLCRQLEQVTQERDELRDRIVYGETA